MDTAKFISLIDCSDAEQPTEAALAAFEKSLGCRLPDDYRAFLLACAGGYCSGAANFNWPQGHWAGGVQGVLGLRRNHPDCSLVEVRQTPQWPMVDELLWIMSDDGGNPICMTIDKAHFGKIWFVDHEVAEYDKPWTLAEAISDKWGYVLPLAPTFGDFLAGLYEEAEAA
ncbi:SMI1/KNR4 family protein [Bradyrhizobium diazoefficiens]|nr:SMI1/KNR4 family protein [Bradyrhizobium diazoefficiens]MBR0776031.1 SMI1/KNR4 family protein [Bradyrhizobium diazoefficiens]